MKSARSLVTDGTKGTPPKSSKEEARKHKTRREDMSNKYTAMRQQIKQSSGTKQAEQNIASAKVSLLDGGNSSGNTTGGSSGLASKWETMKTGFQSFRANIGAKKFLPLRQAQETKLIARANSLESLDEIFQRLKRPSSSDHELVDEDDKK